MRDWLLPFAPVAVVLYFVVFPQQFEAVMNWAARLVH